MDWGEREKEFYSTAIARGLRPPSHPYLQKALSRISAYLLKIHSSENSQNGILGLSPLLWTILTLLFLVSVAFANTLRSLLVHLFILAVAFTLTPITVRRFFMSGVVFAYAFTFCLALPVVLNVVFPGQVIVPLWGMSHDIILGPWVIPAVIGITKEGCLTALTFFVRATSSVSSVFLLLSVIRWTELLDVLRTLRVPPIFIQVIGMTVSYLHHLLRHTQDTHFGKVSRTICCSNIQNEYQWVGSRIGNTWERSLSLMIEVEQAMTARGFTGTVSDTRYLSLRRNEWATLVLIAILFVGVHFV